MLKYRDELCAKIPEIIEKIEEQSAVEIVFHLTHRSGNYRDLTYLAGIITASLTMLFLIVSPYNFSPHILIPDIILGFFLAFPILKAFPQMYLLLSSNTRRQKQVEDSAVLAFYRHGIMRTRDHTGILIYISALEKIVKIVADSGVVNQVAAEEIRHCKERLEYSLKKKRLHLELDQIMQDFGKVLADFLPVRENDRNELSNEVRSFNEKVL